MIESRHNRIVDIGLALLLLCALLSLCWIMYLSKFFSFNDPICCYVKGSLIINFLEFLEVYVIIAFVLIEKTNLMLNQPRVCSLVMHLISEVTCALKNQLGKFSRVGMLFLLSIFSLSCAIRLTILCYISTNFPSNLWFFYSCS